MEVCGVAAVRALRERSVNITPDTSAVKAAGDSQQTKHKSCAPSISTNTLYVSPRSLRTSAEPAAQPLEHGAQGHAKRGLSTASRSKKRGMSRADSRQRKTPARSPLTLETTNPKPAMNGDKRIIPQERSSASKGALNAVPSASVDKKGEEEANHKHTCTPVQRRRPSFVGEDGKAHPIERSRPVSAEVTPTQIPSLGSKTPSEAPQMTAPPFLLPTYSYRPPLAHLSAEDGEGDGAEGKQLPCSIHSPQSLFLQMDVPRCDRGTSPGIPHSGNPEGHDAEARPVFNALQLKLNTDSAWALDDVPSAATKPLPSHQSTRVEDPSDLSSLVVCPLRFLSCCLQGKHRRSEMLQGSTMQAHMMSLAGLLMEVRTEQHILQQGYTELQKQWAEQKEEMRLLRQALGMEAVADRGSQQRYCSSKNSAEERIVKEFPREVSGMWDALSGDATTLGSPSAEGHYAQRMRYRTSSAAMMYANAGPPSRRGDGTTSVLHQSRPPKVLAEEVRTPGSVAGMSGSPPLNRVGWCCNHDTELYGFGLNGKLFPTFPDGVREQSISPIASVSSADEADFDLDEMRYLMQFETCECHASARSVKGADDGGDGCSATKESPRRSAGCATTVVSPRSALSLAGPSHVSLTQPPSGLMATATDKQTNRLPAVVQLNAMELEQKKPIIPPHVPAESPNLLHAIPPRRPPVLGQKRVPIPPVKSDASHRASGLTSSLIHSRRQTVPHDAHSLSAMAPSVTLT